MNVRDPFNIHQRSALSVLRTTASQAATQISERAVDAGVNALETLETSKHAVEDMSFSIPKNVPAFNNPQRLVEDHIWGNSAGGKRGLSDIFQSKDGLPMYKDKPYAYPYRVRPFWKKRRSWAFALILIFIFYYFNLLERIII